MVKEDPFFLSLYSGLRNYIENKLNSDEHFYLIGLGVHAAGTLPIISMISRESVITSAKRLEEKPEEVRFDLYDCEHLYWGPDDDGGIFFQQFNEFLAQRPDIDDVRTDKDWEDEIEIRHSYLLKAAKQLRTEVLSAYPEEILLIVHYVPPEEEYDNEICKELNDENSPFFQEYLAYNA